MKLKNRLERLENTSPSNNNIASITYFEDKQTKVEAVAEFESKNGPISNYCIRFFTMYETKPVASKEKLQIS
jgi:hypothetical protein